MAFCGADSGLGGEDDGEMRGQPYRHCAVLAQWLVAFRLKVA